MSSWRRTYWSVWGANLVTAMGMQSFLPFFPSHLEALGLHDRASIATWSGLVFGAAPLSAAFMAPVWGALGDRFGRRLMVLRAMFALSVFVGLMAFARTPLELLLLRISQGVFSGFLAPSLTLVSLSTPSDRQGRVSASLQSALALGTILGPVLGGVLRSWWGISEVYLCVSAAAGLSGLAVWLLAREDPGVPRRQMGEGRLLAGVISGTLRDIRDLFGDAKLRAALLLLFCLQFGLGATNPILELFVRDVWRGSASLVPSLTGIAFGASAGVHLLCISPWGRWGDRRGHGRVLLICALWCGLALAGHALVTAFGALVLARLLLGAGMAGASPAAFGVAAEQSTAERRGGAFGVVFSARALALSAAAMTGGALSVAVGIRGLFLLGAVVLLATAWAFRGLARPS